MFSSGFEGIRDINYPLEGKMPRIIDYFVKVYGEKYRKRITEKLNDACYFFLDDGNKGGIYSADIYLKERRKEAIYELTQFKKDYCGYEILDYDTFADFLPRVRHWQVKIPESEYVDFMQFASSVDISLLSKAKTSLSTRKLFGKTHDEGELKNNIEDEKPKETLGEILKFFESEWWDFDIASSNIDYIESERERLDIRSLGKTITKEETLAALLMKNELEERKLFIRSIELYVKFISGHYSIPLNEEIMPDLVKIASDYTYFSLIRDEEDLSDKKVDQFIEMFEDINEIAQKKIDMTGVEKDRRGVVIRHLKDMSEKFNALLLEKADLFLQKDFQNGTLPDFEILKEVENREALDEYEIKMILDERLGFQHFNERIGGACLCTAEKNSHKQFTVCFNSALANLSDNSLIHEMGHIIDGSCRFDGEKYTFKTGLTVSERGEDKNFGTFKNYDRYTALNEIINDFYTLKVVREMQKDDFKVGLRPNSLTIYSLAFPFLNAFMTNYKQQLLDSKMSEDPKRIFKYFAKEDVDALADACTAYIKECCKNEKLSSSMVYLISKNDTNAMTKITQAYPQETTEIFNAMNDLARTVEKMKLIDMAKQDELDNSSTI